MNYSIKFSNKNQNLLLTGELTLKNSKAIHQKLLSREQYITSIEMRDVSNIDVAILQLIAAIKSQREVSVSLHLSENLYNIVNNSGLTSLFEAINIQN